MNSFGRIFRISIFGESHGKGVGILVDGCPPGIAISPEDFSADLARRKSGAKGTTPRVETDLPEIESGILHDKTTGSPILIRFGNHNIKSGDYSSIRHIPRPGHADFTSREKYKGFNDPRGGGHFSGRLTLGLVAAGVIAKKMVEPVRIHSEILAVGNSTDIEKQLDLAIQKSDSIGALLQCTADNMPVGLGEPFFDSLESSIAHLVFSIPAVKGIEFGAGFKSVQMYGSEMNDLIQDRKGTTSTNNHGGINGGISNGNQLVFRVAVKPASSIGRAQKTYNYSTDQIEELTIEGRHDACIGLRVPPVLEAVTAIVLADMLLLHRSK